MRSGGNGWGRRRGRGGWQVGQAKGITEGQGERMLMKEKEGERESSSAPYDDFHYKLQGSLKKDGLG